MRIPLFHFLLIFLLLPLGSTFAAEPEAKIELDPRASLNAYAALVEQEFQHARSELRILAATENALSADWNRIRGPLAALKENTPTSAAVWFVRPDGSYFTVAAGLADQNLKDRAYFASLMSGKEIAGDLVVSKATGKRSTIIAVPIQAGGRTIGALGVSIALEKVATFIDEKVALPSEVMFYALDSHGQVALHRESKLLFEFAAQLGSPTLTEALKEMLARPQGTVHYEFEGTQRTAIYKRSDKTDWLFALRW